MTRYVVAVSGGIDSMALLDMLATNYQGILRRLPQPANWSTDFIVATFDHGIRADESHSDALFVAKRCRDYGVDCRIGHGGLPPNTSEEVARQARYRYLRQVASDCGNAEIITAHHQDDLLETAVMNLVRGTGWRGLAPMTAPDIVRPLLGYSKTELVFYVLENDLPWVDDETNYAPNYFRNRLRMLMANWSESTKRQLLDLINGQLTLRTEIKVALAEFIAHHVKSSEGQFVVQRYDLIMLPNKVAIEVLHELTNARLTRPQLEQLLLFTKTAHSGKKAFWGKLAVTVNRSKMFIQLNA